MGRLVVEKAREIHRRYPGLAFPIDMEWLAAAEGCECLSWPFLEPVQEVKQGRWIGLAEGLNHSQRRYLIAHALAHQLLHTGNQLSFSGWHKSNIPRQEREADECALHILMPENELMKVIQLPVWELAEYFGVPEEMVKRRLFEFATDDERQRWQIVIGHKPFGGD